MVDSNDVKDALKDAKDKAPAYVDLIKAHWKTFTAVFVIGFILGAVIF